VLVNMDSTVTASWLMAHQSQVAWHVCEGRSQWSESSTLVAESPVGQTLRIEAVKTWLAMRLDRLGRASRAVMAVAASVVAICAEALARGDRAIVVWSLFAAAAVAAAIAPLHRGSVPIAVAVVGLVVVATAGLPVMATVGLFIFATRRRDRLLAAMSACAIVTFTVTWLFTTKDDWGSVAVLAVLVTGFPVAAGAYVGARRDLLAALRERAERAEADEVARIEQAQLAERSRIAREMHDVLAHKVSLIALHAGAMEVHSSLSPEQVSHGVGLIRTTANEAMLDLREVLGALRPNDPDGVTLSPAPQCEDIRRVVEASRCAGVDATLQMNLDHLPDLLARVAHRVVREGLTNAHKHARGAAAMVTVAGGPIDGLTIEVVNDRPNSGVAMLSGSGVGLVGLGERVGLLGGFIESGPSADGGWRVEAWLPWGQP
jgi:signal transduction histidine kinase